MLIHDKFSCYEAFAPFPPLAFGRRLPGNIRKDFMLVHDKFLRYEFFLGRCPRLYYLAPSGR